MSDGNTATQAGIGPVGHSEEADMLNQVRKAFEYACNMITEASHLRTELTQFKAEFDGLRGEVEKLRQSNSFLDDLATQLRRERDASGQRVHELEMTLHERHARITQLEHAQDDNEASIRGLLLERDVARTERDNAQLRVMELEEENAALKAKLEAVNKALNPSANVGPAPMVEPSKTVEAPVDVPQQEGESTEAYVHRVGRYPSEREARAAAQPRAEGGQFVADDPSDPSSWRF